MYSRSILLFVLLICFGSAYSQETVYSGEFEADSFFTTFEGSWKINKSDSGLILVFEDDFEAKKAPDLKVFFSSLPLSKINGNNAANSGSSVLLSPLKKYKGRMEFSIPAEIKLDQYRSIIVHCEKYAKLWGGSPLN